MFISFKGHLFVIIIIMKLNHHWYWTFLSFNEVIIFYTGFVIISLSSIFVVTWLLWGSSFVVLVAPPGFLSILGPGFWWACGRGTCGSVIGCEVPEPRPEAHSQSLLSSKESESAWLSWITGSPFTNTIVLRTLSYVVSGFRFRRFAGPQSDVGWHKRRTFYNRIKTCHVCTCSIGKKVKRLITVWFPSNHLLLFFYYNLNLGLQLCMLVCYTIHYLIKIMSPD